jgi:hypothetical protein
MGWERCRGGDDTRDPFEDGTPALDDGGVGNSAKPMLGETLPCEEGLGFVRSGSPEPVEICVGSWWSGVVPRCEKIA